MAGCFKCDRVDSFLYECQHCNNRFCPDHSEPEAHHCPVQNVKFPTTQAETDTQRSTITEKSPDETAQTSEAETVKATNGTTNRNESRQNVFPSLTLPELKTTKTLAFTISIIAITVTASFLGIGVLTEQPADIGGWVESIGGDTGKSVSDLNRSVIEQQVLINLNRARESNGLKPVSVNPQLREIARYHSEDMVAKGYINHTSPSGETMDERFSKFNYSCETAGEILFLTHFDRPVILPNETVRYTSNEEIATGIVDGWLTQEGQRSVIMDFKWATAGVGVAISPDGEIYVTLNVCD